MKLYLFIILLFLPMAVNFAQSSEETDSLKAMGIVEDFWKEFTKALIEKDTNYLIKHSKDSIECGTCFFKEGVNAKWFTPQYIYENHLNEFYYSDLLPTLQPSFHQNEEQYMINYSIKDETAPEGGYNIIYTLVFRDGQVKLLSVYTIP